jgi:glycosyltransferase involved in cell wall biosynthesis
MKVLIFHGYLLRGTGSNVYNASLAAALAALGHEVHMVCQDREPPALVPPGAAGSVTVHVPDIGGLLPVYVHDDYEGFEVKTFAELTDAELDNYLESNVTAVTELVSKLGGVDAALANHLVMGPVILARAGLRYAIKVHGSDLSYTVIPDLDRFGPYAQEACDGAAGILVGSGHIAARLRRAVDDPTTNAKVRLGPPGVDTDLFAPLAPKDRPARLSELAAALRGLDERQEGSSWDRDTKAAAEAVEWFAEAQGPRVVYVGKLIVSKGVDLLLAAWPLIHRANPDARLLIVGFGALDSVLRGVWDGLASGDLGPLRELAERGRGLEGVEDARLSMLSAFLAELPPEYEPAAHAAAGSVVFSGRLEHDEVATPVAASESLVFPSTFPEAFGMVAAEAAATEALPVSAHHSGAAEVSRALAADLPDAVAGLLSFDLDDGAVGAIASRVDGWISLPASERDAAGGAMRETVDHLYSWRGVARTVLAASHGQLDGLPIPVED